MHPPILESTVQGMAVTALPPSPGDSPHLAGASNSYIIVKGGISGRFPRSLLMVAGKFEFPPEKIAAFCRKWKITEFSVFGSVLRDDFAPESDVDCLVVFSPESSWTLLDVIGAEEELSELIGRPADLVERSTVEQSENWIRRKHILNTAQTLYAR